MFERDLAVIGEQITAILTNLGIPNAGEVKWQPTPFAGEWGQGTNIAFQSAFAGFYTIRACYPGDIGLSVITVVWAYNKFYRGQEPQGLFERGQWLLKIYAEATALLTAKDGETPDEKARREAYDAERREMYRRWDQHDPEVRELWRLTRQWSLDELDAILAMLGIKIDIWF